MSTYSHFQAETEYALQKLFERWDEVFGVGGWDSEAALSAVSTLDIYKEYQQHLQEGSL